MIEFGLKKRATNGKKSRCLKKFLVREYSIEGMRKLPLGLETTG